MEHHNLYEYPCSAKAMPHINDKIDFTVEVFIVYQSKVLLRKHDKYKIWLSVGGHIELDEDPNQAALREVKEEVGLDVTLYAGQTLEPHTEHYRELISPPFLDRHRINENHEHITMVYFASSNTDQLVLSEQEKTEECRWFTKEELSLEKYQIKPAIQKYARAALEKLG